MNPFTLLVYQPFFNLLVGIYWLLGVMAPTFQNMGNAVILFTIVFRILWLPITFASGRSAKERHGISEKIKETQKEHAKDPIKLKEAMSKIMKTNRVTVIFSAINILFQLMVILMLYRIFNTGLEGADFHLIYDWMPPHPEHFNLTFLGQFDLTKPNWTLNLITALIIFVAEAMSSWLSPFPTGRNELLALFVLPLGALTYFAYMPAGKKLFMITTLLFSVGIMSYKLAKIIIYESRVRLRKMAYGVIIDKPNQDKKK